MEFDEKFLQEMGLSAMPEEQKAKFLEYIQHELEVRIGERISKGLSANRQVLAQNSLKLPFRHARLPAIRPCFI